MSSVKMANKYSTKENGFTLVELMIAMIIIGLVSAVMMSFMAHASNSAKNSIFNQFEQWAISHPYEAEQMKTNPVRYQDFVQKITGEEASNSRSTKTVTYIERENGHYDFCVASQDNRGQTYRWSSETQKSTNDETCKN